MFSIDCLHEVLKNLLYKNLYLLLDYLAYLDKVKHKCLIEPDMLEYLNRALQRVGDHFEIFKRSRFFPICRMKTMTKNLDITQGHERKKKYIYFWLPKLFKIY